MTTINPAAGAVWIRVYYPSQTGSIGNLRFQSIVSGRVANVAIGILPNNAFQVGAPLSVASATLSGATRSGSLRLRLQVICMQDAAAWMDNPCDFNGDSVADEVDLDAIMSVAANWAY